MKRGACSCEHCQHKICAGRVPIFSSLDVEELNKVVNLILRRQYGKGEMIILEGSGLESLIIINQGRVKVFRDTQEGREQILYIFSEGDFFGEKNLFRSRLATYNVETLETTSLCTIRKDDFQQLLREYPEICIKIMDELCSRLDRLENAIENMGARNVEARVSAVLLEFAQKYGKAHSDGLLIELPLSREGIASYIGLTRETVSRKMNHLQAEGIIEMMGNKRVILRDRAALERQVE